MRELAVVGVRVEMPSNVPMLLLREVDGERYLPIWIGATEATAIVNALEGLVPPRPLTHDLLASILDELGYDGDVEGTIVSMRDGVFYAELKIGDHVVQARPSDVVALSLRMGFLVRCPAELMDEVGVEASERDEDEVEKFREFLDQINPDDF